MAATFSILGFTLRAASSAAFASGIDRGMRSGRGLVEGIVGGIRKASGVEVLPYPVDSMRGSL